MSRLNILKISLPLILFVVFLNFSSSQNFSDSNVSVNIEWQAIDSYTPTFYEGKALPGEEAYIKIIKDFLFEEMIKKVEIIYK